MARHPKQVSAERLVPAAPEAIFDVLADPACHPLIDGSDSVKAVRSNPGRLYAGARFKMGMHLGLPYAVTNRVVEFEEGRRIAWCHFARNIWRYELQPVDGGTLVKETFDWSTGRGRRLVEALGFPERNAASMTATLERLEALVLHAKDSPR